jgi:mannosyltransferase OCH1-like enzyme
MRIRFYAVVIIVLLTAACLISRLVSFIQIFLEHTGIAITQDEIMNSHLTPNSRQQYIPKIIHQVFHDWNNQSMPEDWKNVRQTCIDLNPGWEHKVG